MANKKAKTTDPKVKKTSFNIRCTKRAGGFPADLLRLIKGVAGNLGMDQDEFATRLLAQEMQRFLHVQKEIDEWWAVRVKNEKEDFQ